MGCRPRSPSEPCPDNSGQPMTHVWMRCSRGTPSGGEPRSRLADHAEIEDARSVPSRSDLPWPGVLPVSSSIEPSLCEVILWCSDRTSEIRCPSRACNGKTSQTSSPGTVVRIGRSGPRYSLGASGLQSYVSSLARPAPHPEQDHRRIGRRVAGRGARPRSRSVRPSPPSASVPAQELAAVQRT